jgi:hypothetical protein
MGSAWLHVFKDAGLLAQGDQRKKLSGDEKASLEAELKAAGDSAGRDLACQRNFHHGCQEIDCGTSEQPAYRSATCEDATSLSKAVAVFAHCKDGQWTVNETRHRVCKACLVAVTGSYAIAGKRTGEACLALPLDARGARG